jgi:6-phosphogluconate dehydrogenase
MSCRIYLIMGVSGSGKTTVGKMLSEKLGILFFDADDFHSIENIQKMKNGTALEDSDRLTWLQNLNKRLLEVVENQQSVVLACSALKEKYRVLLASGLENHFKWIFLKGDFDLISKRLRQRANHFMSPHLLQSQFDALEEPHDALTIELGQTPLEILTIIMENITRSAFGLVGLGVMGKSLARNFARNEVKLSLFNRLVTGKEEKVAEQFIASHEELSEAMGFEDLGAFVDSIEQPRKIFLMIKAGEETDIFISQILPFLSAGDILIDGGNSHYKETQRRIKTLKEHEVDFIGAGVSGGEYGALHGPSIMPSGDFQAFKKVENYLAQIAAKDKNGKSCCTYIGKDGAGHFIKMIHNGIEYAEMQLLAEAYGFFKYKKGLDPGQIAGIFEQWGTTDVQSYLLEITSKILRKKEHDQSWLIDQILDCAGNKGTGNWATQVATELGMPATLITAALFARYVSSLNHNLESVQGSFNAQASVLPDEKILEAYFLARKLNHQQGFALIKNASETFNWNLDLAEIARIWTNGCIIRSRLMEDLVDLFKVDSNPWSTLLFDETTKSSLRCFCLEALESDLPIPCHLAALDYANVLRKQYPTANIIQAQRDFFGAHTFQKVGDSSGAFYHVNWETEE